MAGPAWYGSDASRAAICRASSAVPRVQSRTRSAWAGPGPTMSSMLAAVVLPTPDLASATAHPFLRPGTCLVRVAAFSQWASAGAANFRPDPGWRASSPFLGRRFRNGFWRASRATFGYPHRLWISVCMGLGRGRAKPGASRACWTLAKNSPKMNWQIKSIACESILKSHEIPEPGNCRLTERRFSLCTTCGRGDRPRHLEERRSQGLSSTFWAGFSEPRAAGCVLI